MRLIIGSRKSDLARCQAYSVANELLRVQPDLKLEFLFKSSAGDLDQDSLLTKMGDKGVFTQDFKQDLVEGRCDLVVHSWKDLPVESHPSTAVVATLPRADARDVLLVHKERWQSDQVRVLSSSPRREYNLNSLLPKIWPYQSAKFSFIPVRGNVPTRIKKLLRGDGDSLIVAKAALDRLLAAKEPEFSETQIFLREALRSFRWMILPLSENPSAAAQGALAIEIRSDRPDLKNLLARINHMPTMKAVLREREVLSSYGGGCHQKIGVSIFDHEMGSVYCLRGLTTNGRTLSSNELISPEVKAAPIVSRERLLGREITKNWFQREWINAKDWQNKLSDTKDLFVAKANAWPKDLEPFDAEVIWCAGLSTWQKLAQRGVWVNGCQDSLGENELTRITELLGREPKWSNLTHVDSAGEENIGTYKLVPKVSALDLSAYSHFYWSSGSAFRLAWKLDHKSLERGQHFCGPGKTMKAIENCLGTKPRIFWNESSWRKAMLGEKK